MDVTSIMQMNLDSVLQSVNIATMRKAMSADAQAVTELLGQLEQANPVTPPGYQLYTHV